MKLENKSGSLEDKNIVKESTIENFSMLRSLVPSLSESSMKISKAGQLMKASDHIEQLQQDNETLNKEIEMLKSSSHSLLKDITGFQNQLSCKSSHGQLSGDPGNKDGENGLQQLFSKHSF